MTTQFPTIGFVGLGSMGGPMARNLLRSGYQVFGYDLSEDRLAAAVSAGAVAVRDLSDLVKRVDIIITSLPSSSVFVAVADEWLLPQVRPGQIIIDLGTVTPPETRRLAAQFETKGVDLLDVPVSGGPGGAEKGQLYMFAGGREAVVAKCRPILEVLGGSDRFTYCGPSGCGQVVKGVNQLMMGVVNAAYLEAIAYGVNGGVEAETIRRAIGDTGRWRKDFSNTAENIVRGLGVNVGVKFRELPYFIQEAEESGFPLPLTKTLYQFCDAGERIVIDDNREAPSFWNELLTHKKK